MKEGWHLKKYNAIEVPEKEVREAIRAGIRKAGLSVSKKKNRPPPSFGGGRRTVLGIRNFPFSRRRCLG